jgi:hypothetical protein
MWNRSRKTSTNHRRQRLSLKIKTMNNLRHYLQEVVVNALPELLLLTSLLDTLPGLTLQVNFAGQSGVA